MTDHYLTLATPASGYFMDKGSKFYAYAFPVDSEEQASALLQQVKKEHPKARHYCTAIRLFPDASLERSNDDGEPSGSAGKPILGQLIRHQLTHVFVVVVRYFGGTKLGIPGLIEAYKTSTADALQQAKIIERFVYGLVRIRLSYELYASFINFVKQEGIPVWDESFEDTITLTVGFRKSTLMESLLHALSRFSHMDFLSIEAFASHLGMEITVLLEDRVR